MSGGSSLISSSRSWTRTLLRNTWNSTTRTRGTLSRVPWRKEEKNKLTSVKDSVKTLGICKKINKTLTQKQKVVVLSKLLELVNSDKNLSSQGMEIINTVSTVFNIAQDEYKLIESFVISENRMC